MGQEVERLQKFASVAPFGKGNKTVYDHKYRKAMEITVSPIIMRLAKAKPHSLIDSKSSQIPSFSMIIFSTRSRGRYT